jgi:hypothetical protein
VGDLLAGDYPVTATKAGYMGASGSIHVAGNFTQAQDTLQKSINITKYYIMSGQVREWTTQAPIAGIKLYSSLENTTSGPDGRYSLKVARESQKIYVNKATAQGQPINPAYQALTVDAHMVFSDFTKDIQLNRTGQ